MPLFGDVFLPTGTADGRTQQIDTDDDFMSFFHIMSYEMPLSISSGELAASSILSTRACCVTSAELTIKTTQRQLQFPSHGFNILKSMFVT